nr:integrase, catalytic region, zinc finger, CCHC-type, peptidase aspartic, catalytic [Tanacetum cinerariifolium]
MFLKMIQVRLNVPVRRIRTGNGTEFVNQILRDYYEEVGISYETSVARSPQQNGVVKRRNRTLIEAAPMASEQSSSGPALQEMIPGTINAKVIAPIAEVITQVDDDLTGSPSSTTVDQDAPSPSKSLTPIEIQSPVILQGVGNDNLDIEVAHMGNDPKAYKEYNACAMGEASPKPKASARKKNGDSASSTTPPTLTPTTTVESAPRLSATAKGKQPSRATTPTEPTDVQRTEVEQLKIVLKRSRQKTHISQQSGSSTDKGTGSKPGVPDVPSDDSEEELSWNSFNDEDVGGREEGKKSDESDDDRDEGTPKPKASARKKKGESASSTTPPIPTPTTTVESAPRLSATAKGKQPSRATNPTEPTDVQRTEVEQLKIVLKRSRQETHISQQSGSGTDEGTGSKPGVPDVPSDDSEGELSWNSFDDEDVGGHEKGNKSDESDDDRDEGSDDDSEETVKAGAGKDDDDDEDDDDNDEEEELAKSDEEDKETGNGGDEVRESEGESVEEETRQEEEESFDPILRTPEESDEESNDEEEQDLRLSEEERIQEEEDADKLYRDVNINQG